jgi:hypothetical protein
MKTAAFINPDLYNKNMLLGPKLLFIMSPNNNNHTQMQSIDKVKVFLVC